MSLNGRLSRNEAVITLTGDNASAHIAGAAVGDGDLGVAVVEHPLATGVIQPTSATDIGHGPGDRGQIGANAETETVPRLESASCEVEVAVRTRRSGDVSRGGGVAGHVHRAGGLIVDPDALRDIAARVAERRHVAAHIGDTDRRVGAPVDKDARSGVAGPRSGDVQDAAIDDGIAGVGVRAAEGQHAVDGRGEGERERDFPRHRRGAGDTEQDGAQHAERLGNACVVPGPAPAVKRRLHEPGGDRHDRLEGRHRAPRAGDPRPW